MDVGRRELLGLIGAGAAGLLPGSALARERGPFDLSALEARHGGRIGVALHDPATRRSLQWRGHERFAYCSTFKLFLAAAVLDRAARRMDRLDRPIPIRREDLLDHAPVTEKSVGRSLTLQALARAAVDASDNPAANILIREMGGLNAWRAWMRSLGDRRTRIDRLELELNSALPGDPRDTTLPVQTVANLQHLFATPRLLPQHRRMLLDWAIESPRGPNRIKAGAPPGSVVAHKIGTGQSPVNDIGLVWLPGRSAPVYVAAYFTEARPGVPLPAREAVLAEAVRLGLQTLIA